MPKRESDLSAFCTGRDKKAQIRVYSSIGNTVIIDSEGFGKAIFSRNRAWRIFKAERNQI